MMCSPTPALPVLKTAALLLWSTVLGFAQTPCFWSPLGTGLAGGWGTVAAGFKDGSGMALYVGGTFSTAGGVPASGLVRWDGTTWSAVGSGLTGASIIQPPSVESLLVFDEGFGPGLYVSGTFMGAGGNPATNVARWDGSAWWPLGVGLSGIGAGDLVVFDDGSGPALYVAGGFSHAGGLPVNNLAKWDGVSWTAVHGGVTTAGPIGLFAPPVQGTAVFDNGSGPCLYAMGFFTSAGGVALNNIARLDCASSISLSMTQPGGPGNPILFANSNLTPSHEYLNIFSLDLCQDGPGTGPFGGLCITTATGLQFLVAELMVPPETPPLRFLAPAAYLIHPPLSLPPITLEAITVDVTGGLLGPISPALRFSIL